jgi:short-subunit dehydrogenase
MAELAVITGASGGLGLEFARCAARDGYDLLLVANEPAKLKSAAKELSDRYHDVKIETVAVDLTRPEAVAEVGVAIGKRPVAVLVNNAGFATYGKFHELPASRELAEVRLNVEAVTHLTRLVLPGMLKAGSGRILNVASVAAWLPGPLMATYYASKAFVLSFSHSLAGELYGTGVTVTVLCPGPTRTGFVARAHLEDSKLFKRRLMDAVHVATKGWEGMMDGKWTVVPGWINRWEVRLSRFVPRQLQAWWVKRSQEEANK